MRLQDKVAIITGGANGIGKAACLRFAEEGAKVVIWDMNEDDGVEVAKQINQNGGTAKFQLVNTADYEAVQAATEAVMGQFGQIDVLVNNAGITRDASLKKMTQDQWQSVIDVNLTGVFNCTKLVSPHMVARGEGRIISTSSIVGLYGNFGQTNYVAAKAGVIGMTKVWARELGRKGITANAVAPGFIATEMVEKVPAEILEDVKTKIPMGHLGKPVDIANTYVFLASDEANFINGAVINVDGGMVS